nr:immunoglobulin heavy chain junction region [Mus musculus]
CARSHYYGSEGFAYW